MSLPSRFFEDLQIGDRRQSDYLTVTEEEILTFSRAYDPQWFHCDAEQAKQSFFGELVASGIHTAALWRVLDHRINGDVAFVCGVAWETVRWLRPLRVNDEICAWSEILSKRESKSSADRGVCVFRCGVRHRDGGDLLTFDSVNMVYRRGALDTLQGSSTST